MAAPNYETTEGNVRFNACVYVHSETGFKYLKSKAIDGGKIYLRCLLRGSCRGSAIISEEDILVPKREHSHGLEAYPDTEIRNLLKRKCSECRGQSSKRQIFDSVTRQHERGGEIAFPEIERSLHRAQRRGQPTVPGDAAEACRLMQEEGAEEFGLNLQMVLDDEAGDIAQVFYSEDMERFASNIQHVNFDGTFFVVPSQFYQLFTVHFEYLNHSFPFFYALMTRKSASLYAKVFDVLKSKFPSFSPQTAMSDFEFASSDTFQTKFPTAEVSHCAFHFAQCIWRKVQKVGLSELYKGDESFRSFIKKVMSLPHLPSDTIRPTTELLFQGFEGQGEGKEKIAQIKRYVIRFWLDKIGPAKFSVHSFEKSTNNVSEAFHSRLKSRIQTHRPNYWTFLQHLNDSIADTKRDIERIESGLQIVRRPRNKYVRNMARRELCKRKLADGTFTPIQYLNSIAYTVNPDVINTGNLERLEMETEVDEVGDEQEPVNEVQQNNRCAVCLGPREDLKIFLPCGHGGCGNCVDIIVSSPNPSCPVCRGNVVSAVQAFL